MVPEFTLVQLRYFLAVARLENMTAAAAEVGISQSALSTAVATLERRLDVQLLVRERSRRVRLTAEGRDFTRAARHLLDHAEQVGAGMHGGGQLRGVLRVGIFSPLAPTQLPSILRDFSRAHPHVVVQVLEGNLADLHAALADGRCDIALTYNLGLTQEFVGEVLATTAPHVAVAPSHPAAMAGRDTIALAELASEPLILLDLPHTRDYFMSVFAAAGVTPTIRHRLSGYETVRSFVARGLGYALLNQRTDGFTAYSGGRLASLAITDPVPAIRVVLARHAQVQESASMGAFADICRRYFDADDARDESGH